MNWLSPVLGYAYDWDPGDSDFINVVLRLSQKMRIYGDWDQTQMWGVYPPLTYWLLLLPQKLGIEPYGFARTLNLWLFAASQCLAMLWIYRALPQGQHRLGYSAMCGTILLTAWSQWSPVVHIKSDPLLLALLLSGACAISFAPKRLWLISSLSAAALLTKQSGIALPLSAITFFAIYDRPALFGYVLRLALLLLPPLGWLEWSSHGYFLSSIWIAPMQWFDQTIWMSSRHRLELFESIYGDGAPWKLVLLIIGVSAILVRRRTHRPLIALLLLFGFDLGIALFSTRFAGSGTPYLWVHYTLATILMSWGVFEIAAFLGKGELRHLGPFFVTWICFFQSLISLSDAELPSLETGRWINEGHTQLIKRLVEKNPNGAWISERGAASILKAGKILDHEMCNLQFAYAANPRALGYRRFEQSLREGKYTYYQTGPEHPCGAPLALASVFKECFKIESHSRIAPYGIAENVDIYRYSPNHHCLGASP